MNNTLEKSPLTHSLEGAADYIRVRRADATKCCNECVGRVDRYVAAIEEALETLSKLSNAVEVLRAGAPIIKCCEHCELCALEREFTDEEVYTPAGTNPEQFLALLHKEATVDIAITRLVREICQFFGDPAAPDREPERFPDAEATIQTILKLLED